jgi:AraC-like DNA-binding protein
MDLLTDLLRHAGLRRRLFDSSALQAGRELPFPCERSFGFHVVTRGPVWLHVDDSETSLPLGSGDIALMARGCHHRLSLIARDGRPVGADAQVLSAAYQLWNPPLHPFFAEVPDWLLLRIDERPRLGPVGLLVELMASELQAPGAGSETVLNGLLDAAFSFLLREVLARAADGPGFAKALRSQPVSRVLQLLHERCAEEWTLEGLALEVGLSRTALAVKFREALGETPMGYLRRLRMQRASQRLVDTDLPLERIASEVGYQDAFGFSRVFKKTLGQSPREFRRRQAVDPMAGLRFHTPVAD